MADKTCSPSPEENTNRYKKRGTVCPHLQGEGRQNYPKKERWSISSSTRNA